LLKTSFHALIVSISSIALSKVQNIGISSPPSDLGPGPGAWDAPECRTEDIFFFSIFFKYLRPRESKKKEENNNHKKETTSLKLNKHD
jgi:hypothetical protein